jgi:general secretion pathway protein D
VTSIPSRDIGIILDVTPHINPDGQVTVDVSPEVSSISDSTVPISSTVNGTVFNLRSASSRVVIRDGDTIVIGGMMQDTKSESVDKIPFIGDIPVLGVLFQHSVVKKNKTELLFFLTPHVAQQPAKLTDMAKDEENGLRLTPHAIEPGAFQDQMEGLQRGGATTQPIAKPTFTPRPNLLPEAPLPGGTK